MTPGPDVIVVGAGLAGLHAARRLRQDGRRVLVLEARDEVGGRTRTRALDGHVVDFGAEWVGWAHRRTRRVVAELGLTVEPAGNLGQPVLWRMPAGERVGHLPPPGSRVALARILLEAARHGRAVDRHAPWAAPGARSLDALSVADWLDRRGVGGDARYILRVLLGALSSSDLEHLSLLHLLWWTRHAGGPLRSLHTTFQWRVTQGAQAIARGIAAGLGDAVRVGAPVTRVTQGDGVVTAELAGGATQTAAALVLAIPAPQVAGIALEPPLPAAQRALSELRVGPGAKVVAQLPAGHPGGFNTVVGGDCLWAGWRRGDIVTGFAPPLGAEVSDDDLRRDLARAFRAAPGDLSGCTVFRWGREPFIAGCDAAFAPGQVCELGPWLAAPHGRIAFAGSERSSWPNNLEGALESGERAAAQVLRTLTACRA